MSLLNIPFARKVVEYIEAHPDEHEQATFAKRAINGCGTTACIAGHALLLSGEYDLTAEWDFAGEFDFIQKSTGEIVVASDHAQALLGVDEVQQETLFFTLQDEDEALDFLRELIVDAEATS